MRNIKVLDCTLRDGGYTNEWQFSDEQIKSNLKYLLNSGVEIIELGYLSQTRGNDTSSTLFSDFCRANSLIAQEDFFEARDFVLMINLGEYDVKDLPEYSGGFINGIRLCFHKDKQKEAHEVAKEIAQKGYDTYIQPMVISNYSIAEMGELLALFSDMSYKGIYIVDSHGVMEKEDLREIFRLFNQVVPKRSFLGAHLHGDMTRTMQNAIEFIKSTERDIVLDASIKGIGRGEGNLHTGAILECLSKEYSKDYNLLLEVL